MNLWEIYMTHSGALQDEILHPTPAALRHLLELAEGVCLRWQVIHPNFLAGSPSIGAAAKHQLAALPFGAAALIAKTALLALRDLDAFVTGNLRAIVVFKLV